MFNKRKVRVIIDYLWKRITLPSVTLYVPVLCLPRAPKVLFLLKIHQKSQTLKRSLGTDYVDN